MSTLTIPVSQFLTNVRNEMRSMEKTIRPFTKMFVERVGKHFRDESSLPAGSDWPELSDDYADREVRGGPRGKAHKLVVSGVMRGSVDARTTSEAGKVIVHLGSNHTKGNGIDVPGVHNFGTKDGRVPARPFLVFQAADVDAVKDALAKKIASGGQRA